MEEVPGAKTESQDKLVCLETIENAKKAFNDFLGLKPKDESVLIIEDCETNQITALILEKAAQEIDSPCQRLVLGPEIKEEEVWRLFEGHKVIMDLSVSCPRVMADIDIYEAIKKTATA